MPAFDVFKEADRQLVICNACRYCEGLCPVFQAIETRQNYKQEDMFYLSNLCHDCRSCYYACMFTPPHQFELNIPQVMSEVRMISYRRWSWPRLFANSFVSRRAAVALPSLVAVLVVVLSLGLVGPGLFTKHVGPGAFYAVIPYVVMVVPALVLLLFGLAMWLRGGICFWSETGKGSSGGGDLKSLAKATGAALVLRHLGCGGPGGSYPDESPSRARRYYHSFVFWGFLADLVSTTLAFILQDFYHILPPYPLASATVILGSLGGVSIILGSVGLIWLKAKSDRALEGGGAYGIDYIFLAVLGLTALTGMLTLIFRSTAALGLLLSMHLSLVAALFITAPYGKFVHAVYRFLALIRFYFEKDHPHQEAK